MEEKKTPVGKIIGCGCVALVLLGLLAGAGIFFGVTKILKSNAPYNDSIAAVQANPAAVAALGEPIKPGLIPTGNISINNGDGTVDFAIPVSGPKGSGKVHVEGTKKNGGPWIYQVWELKVEGAPEPIPLQ